MGLNVESHIYKAKYHTKRKINIENLAGVFEEVEISGKSV